MKEEIVLASNNKQKIEEIEKIYSDVKLLSLNDIGYNDDIVESGNTFLENSLIKAKTISEFLKAKGKEIAVIADDSGLCVEALNGNPGIYSARYSGEYGNNAENRKKLLKELEGAKNRRAYFCCVMVKYFPDGRYIYGEGKTFGEILKEETGRRDFGYDCLFYSDDLKKTFGEVMQEEKNRVSHRARAINDLKRKENDWERKSEFNRQIFLK